MTSHLQSSIAHTMPANKNTAALGDILPPDNQRPAEQHHAHPAQNVSAQQQHTASRSTSPCSSWTAASDLERGDYGACFTRFDKEVARLKTRGERIRRRDKLIASCFFWFIEMIIWGLGFSVVYAICSIKK